MRGLVQREAEPLAGTGSPPYSQVVRWLADTGVCFSIPGERALEYTDEFEV
ncbi:MAG: hypothetical protein HKO65_00480 [Gemmatimonadetes bacterium]|nr:hypothetical protein [Gemmatimonadota bacterium]NNM03548.1 hypothetical protein [Gemmatimonadota bacterium]